MNARSVLPAHVGGGRPNEISNEECLALVKGIQSECETGTEKTNAVPLVSLNGLTLHQQGAAGKTGKDVQAGTLVQKTPDQVNAIFCLLHQPLPVCTIMQAADVTIGRF